MLSYFFLFAVPSLFALTSYNKKISGFSLLLIGVLYIVFTGLRFQTGSDWPAYIKMYESMSQMTLQKAMLYTEPGYAALNWLMAEMGIDIVGVNVAVAIIFISGLIRFASFTPLPWLSLVSVTPYLIIVIGMSATRQAAAIGLVFHVLASWKQSNIKKIALTVIAISFHYSAVVVLYFVLQSMKMPSWFRWVILIVGGGVSFFVLKDTTKIAEYNQTYAVANIVSPGALQHAALNAIPAAVYLTFIKKWDRVCGKIDIMRVLSIASIFSIFAVFISSTAVDRLALYLSPIQMLVYSSLPLVFKSYSFVVAIILYHLLILFVWLNYSNTSFVYIPYKNLLFQ